MKRKTGLIILSIAILVIVSQVFILLNYNVPKQTVEMKYDFYVDSSGRSGFNVDKDLLHFGIICYGCVGKREMSITNKRDFPLEIYYEVISNDKSVNFIYFDPLPGELIQPGEKKEITIYAKPFNINFAGQRDIKYEGKFLIKLFKKFPLR